MDTNVSRRSFLRSPALAAIADLVTPHIDPKRPNVVIIVADGLGWKDVGYHGSQVRTPSLDRVALKLRSHRELLQNWFRAEGTISSGAMVDLNNTLILTTGKSLGFRTLRTTEIALYPAPGALPAPERAHTFC